jgi:hypothetical protein
MHFLAYGIELRISCIGIGVALGMGSGFRSASVDTLLHCPALKSVAIDDLSVLK